MGSKHTLTPPAYFQGVKTPNPHDLRPCLYDNNNKWSYGHQTSHKFRHPLNKSCSYFWLAVYTHSWHPTIDLHQERRKRACPAVPGNWLISFGHQGSKATSLPVWLWDWTVSGEWTGIGRIGAHRCDVLLEYCCSYRSRSSQPGSAGRAQSS